MMRPSTPLFSVSALASGLHLLAALSAPANSPKISSEEASFFETFIRPTLVAECMECHGAEKQKGGLRLDSRPGWQKGGESGAAIVPKDPEGSLLLRSIKHLEPDLKMPEKAPKLDAAVLQNFTRWIAMGAPDTRDEPPQIAARKPAWPELLAARRSWWSLQPLHSQLPTPSPSPDQTAQSAAGRSHPVDQFLNSSLSKAGLTPQPAAPGEVLVRRLHFLLVGLPPSPTEVSSFLAAHARDPKAAARERATKLLASPSFGEHWARHWMDLVRYAESHGSEGDPEIPNAYQYRDYLIRAFNADVPLDQLIREHLAGDLLTSPRVSPGGINESRIGPAHLRMVDHGYQPVDTLDDQVKAVDNQIDVVSKAFQGLTVSCARCHDHKFDAISQRDYTALYGVFSSIRPAQLPIESDARLQLLQKTKLVQLKTTIRAELSAQWLSQLAQLPATLAQASKPPVDKAVAELQSRLLVVDKKLAETQWAAISAGTRRESPAPYAIWTFGEGAEDRMGRVSSELVGGAAVRDGALVLNGKGAFLKTAPLPVEITERTFEAWLSTTNLEQRGGGIVGIEQIATHAFDSVVYAEKQNRKWLAGSNNHKRTEQTDGPEEAAGTGERIHVALSYAADGTISVFQNGKPYGKPFRKDSLHTYPAGDTRLLIGLRHTNAGSGFFEGKIEEVRLYTRALSAGEIAASFVGGTLPKTAPKKEGQGGQGGLNAGSEGGVEKLSAEAAGLRAEIKRLAPAEVAESFAKMSAAPEHPLHLAFKAATLSPAAFATFLPEYRAKLLAKIEAAKVFNTENFKEAWDLSNPEQTKWFTSGPDAAPVSRGDFRVEPTGEKTFAGLLPAGLGASALVPQFGGVTMSPDFKIASKSISVRFAATNGAMLRLIPDNYPLGTASIFPRAIVQRRDAAWSLLDSTYRIDSNAFLELTTPGHQTRRSEQPKGATPFIGGDSYFVVEKVVFHDGKEPPKEVHPALEMLLTRCQSNTTQGFIAEFGNCLAEAVQAWREGTLSEAQRQLLDSSIQCQILPATHSSSAALEQAIAQYRGLTQAMPQPNFAPGVLEHQAVDAAFLPRGDYKKPGERVPRGFLEVLDARPIQGAQSGRLELAERMLSKNNPLTSRVMANRIWQWTFGAGIVPTPDNFGRMGEKPSHPELLDFLALKLQQEGWSLKTALAYLLETDAFQRSSLASEEAATKDPLNALLSHANVRRLEAESIRDALLSVSGALEPQQFGPSVAPAVARRSIYLQQRRNNLPALLTTFDAPKPFTTLGRRDSTTVPAQSLLLLNDPAIMQLSKRWAEAVRANVPGTDARIRAMFVSAFGRPPSETEAAKAQAFLNASGNGDNLTPLAHALFNLKEFIYLR